MAARGRRWALAGVAVGGLLVTGAVLGSRSLVESLRGRVAGAFGPDAEIAALEIGVHRLAVTGLRVPGGPGWPTRDALRTAEIAIVPSLRSLVSSHVQIARVTVERPYVSALRTAARVRILPSLTETPRSAKPRGTRAAPAPPAHADDTDPPGASAPSRDVVLHRLVIDGGEADVVDATVAHPPWRIHLTQVDLTAEDVTAPPQPGHVPVTLRAVVDGPRRDGVVTVRGWVDAVTRDLDLDVALTQVDLLALEPYLMRSSRGQLRGGLMDLTLHATVARGRVDAPGHLVLSDLVFADGGSGAALVLGVPRTLLVQAMGQRHGRLALDFHVTGDLADPAFSLDESMQARVAASLAEAVGVSVKGLVTGVGSVGGGSVDAVRSVGRQLGGALQKLLGR